MGIMIGDGGIAPYHISITLHSKDDKLYSKFILRLIKNLFKVEPTIYLKNNCQAMDIVIQRKMLVDFCISRGLVLGNKVKQGITIPSWILERQDFVIACLRGLFDTDGSVYKHSYISKDKRYSYLKIGFSSASRPLIDAVLDSLKKMGFCARIGPLHNFVYIESQKDVRKFIELVGSHNPKHLRKMNKFWRRG